MDFITLVGVPSDIACKVSTTVVKTSLTPYVGSVTVLVVTKLPIQGKPGPGGWFQGMKLGFAKTVVVVCMSLVVCGLQEV